MNKEEEHEDDLKDCKEDEFEIIFEPSPQLKADVIWGENKRRLDAPTE